MDDIQTYVSELIARGLTQQELAKKITSSTQVKVTQADICRFKEGSFKRPTFEKVNAVRRFYFSFQHEKA